MPGKGYSTIGVKPAVMERLQQITDKNYLGMFLPSTLIIMMNEVEAGRYAIHAHKLRLDLTGRYNTITIRSDIKEWLKSSYEDNKEEYLELYNVKCFTRFVSYFEHDLSCLSLLQSHFFLISVNRKRKWD